MENYFKILYKKFLYGNICKDEFMELRHKLNNSEFSELKNILNDEWKEGITSDVLLEKDKEEIKSKLNFYIEYEKKRKIRLTVMRYAAVLIPLIFIASFFIITTQIEEPSKEFVVIVKPGNRVQVTLPDQSKVWINSNSKLVYRMNKQQHVREVKLTGEAFFKVYKNKKLPFVVLANSIQVEALGTSFNVKASPGSDIVETSLVEGSVKLSGADLSQDYYLKPNEKAIYSNLSKKVDVETTDNELETAWKDNKLQFRSEKFSSVLNRIENWYGVKIISKCSKIENDLISGSFRNEPLNNVMESFAIQFNIKYDYQNDSLIVICN